MNRDETNGTLNVAKELLEILKENSKGHISLGKLKQSPYRKRLGLPNNLPVSKIREILEPHLEGKLAICKKGNSFYLFRGTDIAEIVLSFIRERSGKSGPDLTSQLSFVKKDEMIGILNGLLKSGKIMVKLVADFSPRFFISEPLAGAEAMSTSAGPGLNGDSMELRRGRFLSAFRELDGGRVFIRIPDLRRRLMWPREVFDGVLRALRDDEVVQLHSGDVTAMTPGEVEDCFVDEFGSRKGTVTLKK